MQVRLPSDGPTRIGGLDGLRAIAVTLVVVYHLFPAALPGGFLGVDVFFVISGFLIATLLLTEHRNTGSIAFGDFWRRRARRLLPALALVLLVCTSSALLLGEELLTSIGEQLAGSALFVANWVYIALGSDYFAQDHPELFRNMWSLAIEEQFYLLLPLALLFSLRMRSRASRTLFFGFFGAASAIWMAMLFGQGASATRVYFGTDTHLFGLLLGVALACAITPSSRSTAGGSIDSQRGAGDEAASPAGIGHTARQLGLLALVATGLAVLGVLAATLREGSPQSFTGGMQAAVLAMLLTVWAATRPGAWAGIALDFAPLRWIGERSYGIYLWHWPLLLIVGSVFNSTVGASPWLIAAVTLLLTLVFSALSYHFIEQPVRRVGLRRSLARLLQSLRLRDSGRRAAVVTIGVLAVTLPATGIAIAIAPDRSSDESIVRRGQAVLDAQQNDAVTRQPAHRGTEAGGAEHRGKADGAPASNSESPGSPVPAGFDADWAKTPSYEAPAPEPVEGWQMIAIGDSVMLASAPELSEAFPEIWIDAAVSRGLGAGVSIASDLETQGALRPVIVVGLGTNGPIDGEDLEALRQVAGDRRIVLVNAYADRWWIPEVNQQLAAFARKHRGVTLADWNATIPRVEGGLAPDEIHPNPSGGTAYAESVQQALDALLERDEQPKKPH